MIRVLRLIALGLLVAALPLRGYAAAAMLFCGGARGMPATASAPMHHDAADTRMGHGDEGHGAADHHATHVDHAMASADNPDAGGCGVCGDCCAGVAGSSMLPVLTDLAPAAGPIPFAPPLYRGADLAHAERPPLA